MPARTEPHSQAPPDPHGTAGTAGSAIGARVDLGDGSDQEPHPDGPRSSTGRLDREPGSFWRRLGAYLIDGVILALATNLVARPMLGPIPDVDPLDPAAFDQLWPYYLTNAILAWLYFGLFESSRWQATPGKRVLGLEVTDEAASPISFPRASGRYFGKIASALPLGLGFLMIFVTERNQALHDKLAGCLVLETGPRPERGRKPNVSSQEDW